MGQRSNRVGKNTGEENFRDVNMQFAGETDQDHEFDVDDALAAGDEDIQQTREEIGQTLDAIQAKLQPERLTEDVKTLAQDTVDHFLEESRSTAGDVGEIASVAAMEAVDYATKKIQELLPELRQQAQDAANEAVTHAVAEAKAAVQEMGENSRAALRDATIGRIERMTHTTTETSKYVGSSTVSRIKQNPGPAALAALGISWLFMGGKGSGTQTQTSQSSSGSVTDDVSSMAGHLQDSAGSMTDQVQSGLDTAMNQVHDGLDTAMDQAHQVAGQAQQVATGAASQVQQSAGQVFKQAQKVPSRTRRMVEENPVSLGLVALALGSAAALVLPETRKENQLMGEARDALVETAKTKGHEVADKAQDLVESMQSTVEEVEETVHNATEKATK